VVLGARPIITPGSVGPNPTLWVLPNLILVNKLVLQKLFPFRIREDIKQGIYSIIR